MIDEFDHWHTPEIVCPYCGHVYQDSWDFDGDSGETWCGECEKLFFYQRDFDVYYDTEKIKE